MKEFFTRILETPGDYRSAIPRLIVGLVFLSEGIQKFLFPDITGAGRFETIGFKNPEFMAAFVAAFEITCGILILTGLAIRIAVIPLFIIMLTAIVTTKLPVLTEKGFWSMAHDSRTDFSMTLLLVFLYIYGAGKLSADNYLFRMLNR